MIKARRLNPPSNAGWQITVQPDGDGTVSIVLPITTYCDATGVICTEDGRTLSNRLELTVAGPDCSSQGAICTEDGRPLSNRLGLTVSGP